MASVAPSPANPIHAIMQSTKPRILLAASGSVAAIKFESLCRSFSEWAEVKAVATKASLHFLDSSALPSEVILYTDEEEWSSWKKIGDDVLHIELRKWADAMVIAPLSANTLAKIAGGFCDNLLTCVVRAWDYNKPLYVAPAMNTLMWNNPFTKRHLESINELGISLIPPISKRLACGDFGNGAMAEPSEVYNTVRLSLIERANDGSITRTSCPANPSEVRDDGTAVWKDLQFDKVHDLHLRLYKPVNHHCKLPILFFFHGGAFCVGNRTWPNYHNSCLRLSSELNAVVVAPDYRLAPEHLLPAAIEDGLSAVEWLRTQALSPDADSWLTDTGDFARVFILGDSSGGTIAHHLVLRFAGHDELAPLQVKGYILLAPFFSGTQRTKSELDSSDKASYNLEKHDELLQVILPAGANPDHPIMNPFGPDSPGMELVEVKPMMVVVGGYDLLRDRAVEYGTRLRDWGKPVKVVEFETEEHGFFSIHPWSEPATEFIRVVGKFLAGNGGSSSAFSS